MRNMIMIGFRDRRSAPASIPDLILILQSLTYDQSIKINPDSPVPYFVNPIMFYNLVIELHVNINLL